MHRGRDVLFLSLDTLRFDVADVLFREGQLPAFARLFPDGWERRHAPASFTYASHLAFFAGFLPTPAAPGKHPRRFAVRFPGSETTTPNTTVFDQPDIVRGFAALGYRTICVGGVGFFDPTTALGATLTASFDEVHFEPSFRVTQRDGFERQIDCVAERLSNIEERAFVFLNVASLHQPNAFYLEGRTSDDLQTHAAALKYVDSHLPKLLDVFGDRPLFVIACSDHGTAYGEDGYVGHRIGHDVVWTVPYAEAVAPAVARPSVHEQSGS